MSQENGGLVMGKFKSFFNAIKSRFTKAVENVKNVVDKRIRREKEEAEHTIITDDSISVSEPQSEKEYKDTWDSWDELPNIPEEVEEPQPTWIEDLYEKREQIARDDELAKEEYLIEKEDQFDRAYDTFSEKFNLSEQQYRDMIDQWGGITSEMRQYFGDSQSDGADRSYNLTYAYESLPDKMKSDFVNILNYATEQIRGQGYTQTGAIDYLYDLIDELKPNYV